MIDCWILKIDDLSGGGKFYETAFLTKRKAELAAEDMKEEWRSYIPKKVRGEAIEGARIIVDKTVYTLDESSAKEHVRKRALAKLTTEEKKVLGLE